jgi:hypothetical protein
VSRAGLRELRGDCARTDTNSIVDGGGNRQRDIAIGLKMTAIQTR